MEFGRPVRPVKADPQRDFPASLPFHMPRLHFFTSSLLFLFFTSTSPYHPHHIPVLAQYQCSGRPWNARAQYISLQPQAKVGLKPSSIYIKPLTFVTPTAAIRELERLLHDLEDNLDTLKLSLKREPMRPLYVARNG